MNVTCEKLTDGSLTVHINFNIKELECNKITIDINDVSKQCDKTPILANFCRAVRDRKAQTGQSMSNAGIHTAMIKYLELYDRDSVRLADVDARFLVGFVKFMEGQGLSQGTVANYFTALKTSLNEAVRQGILGSNPMARIERCDRPHVKKHVPRFLTDDSLKKLSEAQCRNVEVKRAFLFSCFTGLRFSDIKSLTYDDIQGNDDTLRLVKQTVKTSALVGAVLPKKAAGLVDSKGCGNVFRLPTLATVESVLREWALNAGICQSVTFHVARHTFATSLITHGVDIYTVSKLLGHSNISTTQMYADVIDSRRDEAMCRLDAA